MENTIRHHGLHSSQSSWGCFAWCLVLPGLMSCVVGSLVPSNLMAQPQLPWDMENNVFHHLWINLASKETQQTTNAH